MTPSPDTINGLFEFFGAWTGLVNIRSLMRDRRVLGFHWGATAFYLCWGMWNLFFYPYLNQWFSFVGGCALMMTNLVWLALVFCFRVTRNENR